MARYSAVTINSSDQTDSKFKLVNALVSSYHELDGALTKNEIVSEALRDRRQGEVLRGQKEFHVAF
jgi:hypothetical protein